MVENNLIHATLVAIDNQGILLKGKSGSGKSDLALRLIENKGAELVADDMVEICVQNGELIGKALQKLSGLLEIRGVGIVKYPCLPSVAVKLVAELKNTPDEVERMPLRQKDVILGLAINKIDLYAKENSAPDKVMVALRRFDEIQAI